MFNVNLPKQFWAEAVLTATYLFNRLPTKVLGNTSTPLQEWFNKKPNFLNLM